MGLIYKKESRVSRQTGPTGRSTLRYEKFSSPVRAPARVRVYEALCRRFLDLAKDPGRVFDSVFFESAMSA
jgi:hypothetical protein